MKKKLKQLDNKIQLIIERYRIKYYHEFVFSVVGFGLTCIYMLYICVRVPLLEVHSDTTLTYNIVQAIRGQDLAGMFFALNPYFDFTSSAILFGGCLWGVIKLFRHSLAKISEVELIPLPKRIKNIEKESIEEENE